MSREIRVAVVGVGKQLNNYLKAVSGVGAVPVPVTAPEAAGDFDGLLLPGGCDIDPARYGQKNNGSEGMNRALDELQFGMLDVFVKAGKPVFGICRGHQMINVYFGGTLIQHIATTQRHTRGAGANQDKAHTSHAEKGSWLERLYGSEFFVNSSHHQAADKLGEGLVARQWAEDGIVEALEHRTLPIYCVQWHPERMCFRYRREDTVDGSLVLADFVETCRKRKQER